MRLTENTLKWVFLLSCRPEDNRLRVGGYRAEDMAAVGASLAVVIALCLVGIGLLAHRVKSHKSDWKKLSEASVFRSNVSFHIAVNSFMFGCKLKHSIKGSQGKVHDPFPNNKQCKSSLSPFLFEGSNCRLLCVLLFTWIKVKWRQTVFSPNLLYRVYKIMKTTKSLIKPIFTILLLSAGWGFRRS